jgi:hypothetical protein
MADNDRCLSPDSTHQIVLSSISVIAMDFALLISWLSHSSCTSFAKLRHLVSVKTRHAIANCLSTNSDVANHVRYFMATSVECVKVTDLPGLSLGAPEYLSREAVVSDYVLREHFS